MSVDVSKKYIIQYTPGNIQGPVGPQGPAGVSVTLPLSSDNVSYNGQTLTAILNQLLYVPLSVSSFVANTILYELGAVLTSIQLTWAYNKAIATQSITGVGVTPPTLVSTDRTANVVLTSLASNTVITLTADDVTGDAIPPVTSTLSIQFLNGIYYGKSTIPGTINSAFIQGLTKTLQATRNTNFSISTAANEYIWYAIPSTYGTPAFTTNGFNGGIDYITTISYTNILGHAENYDVYRSTNQNLGATTVGVS